LFEAGLLSYKKKVITFLMKNFQLLFLEAGLNFLELTLNILGFLQLHRLYDLFGRKSLPPY
jgi:hypothetical protein